MQAAEQRLELCRHDDLAVECEAVGGQRPQRRDKLGEVPRERTLVAAAQVDVVAVTKDEAAETVPLRLVEVAVARQLALEPREHRLQRRSDDGRHRRYARVTASASASTDAPLRPAARP